MKKCPFCAEDIQDEAIYCRFCKKFLVEEPVNTSVEDEKYFSLDRIISFGLMILLLLGFFSFWLVQAWSIGISYEKGFNAFDCFSLAALFHLLLFTVLPQVNWMNKNVIYTLGGLYLFVDGILWREFYLGIEGLGVSNIGFGFYLSMTAYIGILLYGLFCIRLNHQIKKSRKDDKIKETAA